MRQSMKSRSLIGTALWGHLVVVLPGQSGSQAFPIAAEEASRVKNALVTSDAEEWLVVSALNNRCICLCPDRIVSIFLIDDGAEWPRTLEKPHFPLGDYAGYSQDVYKALLSWSDNPGAFEATCSKDIRAAVHEILQAGDFLRNPGGLIDALQHTSIYLSNGATASYQADFGNLIELLDDLEGSLSTRMVEISDANEEFEAFYSARKLSMIVIPQVELDRGD